MNDLLVAGNLKEKTANSDWIAPDAQGKIPSTSTSAFKVSLHDAQEPVAR